MQLLKRKSRGKSVKMLQQLLNMVAFNLTVDGLFGTMTETAVKEFQRQHSLMVDGIVYTQTWTTLLAQKPSRPSGKSLRETDIVNLAKKLEVETAVIRAVMDVESGNGGFLQGGRPKILFEGHIFWQQLKDRGYHPESMKNGYKNVLYPHWTRKYYKGGAEEWDRLSKAIGIRPDADIAEAAYASASYGLFQIMGFNYQLVGFDGILRFVTEMKTNEGYQLQIFGAFLKANHLIAYLQNHDWVGFARRYNGPAYAENQYDKKLQDSYNAYV